MNYEALEAGALATIGAVEGIGRYIIKPTLVSLGRLAIDLLPEKTNNQEDHHYDYDNA